MVENQHIKINPIISTLNLTKKYNQIPVVNNLNLNIHKSCFALLGPNGAGKTTTLLMLLNLIKPTEGKAFIFGKNTTENSVEIRKKIGYLPENIGFYPNMSGRKHLELFYRLRTNSNDVKESTNSLLKWCGLKNNYWDKRIKTYSQGMRQRLGLAIAFAGNPEIVFLDEPLSNIDPIGRVELIDKIKEKEREGITIIISSHIILEVERIADSIAIIFNGNLKISSNIINLSQNFGFNEYEIIHNKNLNNSQETLEAVYDDLLNNQELFVKNPTLLSDKIIIKTEEPFEIKKNLRKFNQIELRPISGTLDKIYRKLVG
ncbi:MAG: ABC transporter ATP-binding protein [Candidatus Hermodarchaeota archaeon]